MIDGVQLKELVTHPDERGFFREVLRASDPILAEGFAQWSHSFMHKGVLKAWHFHQLQIDWWYVLSGRLHVALFDFRGGSRTEGQTDELVMSGRFCVWETQAHEGPCVLRIPAGVAHGCRALADTHLLYVTSQEYDGSDEGRLAHDDPTIGYDWLKGTEIK